MPSTLTSAVLEQPHTAANYLDWVKALIEHVKSEDADGLRKIRLRVGLAKELMEEALPVGLFASRFFEGSTEVSIALKIGNQNYDAILAFDDVMSHDRADNKASIEAVLDSFGERLQVFQVVAVVGLQKGLFVLRPGANAT